MTSTPPEPSRNLTAGFLRNFDLASLRLLLSAIEEGNLARVAAREGFSLSAVSRRISDLEARIGIRLLHRHDRGVSATDAALANLARLRSLFGLIDQLVEDFRAIRDGEKGVVRVRAHLTAITGALPEAMSSFTESHEGIELVVDEATSREIVHAVQLGDCDIGFVSGTVDTERLAVFPWKTDELVVVMPANHRLGGQAALSFGELLDYGFVGMTPGSALLTLFRGQAALLGRTLDERARVSTFDGVVEMVAAGIGIGILPAAVAARVAAQRGLAIRRLSEPWAARRLVICVRDREQLPAAARAFLDHLTGG
ncbi:LysR family transcriptional regulator [Rhizorhabdus dicambivorans]|uniref:LysR family transcriptional regulator n=1 Tax=Rhizorhabdus dicambivorans TaxID=1850238 RepID=A0A2A4FYE2_9SPHN|nr:LysR family transcriptional regulator [Rhizorhabdus dicambivorans]ATE63619.1 LysR family transcriptional regulator [Rhizorhabdus dicambivorans]PCE42745.1 LysR family transcriptional regulator [Rhizorhabdus dicambivorans]